MSQTLLDSSAACLPVVPRCDVSIRVATLADLPFMDGLQKKHSKQLGYFPRKQFEGYITTQSVVIAEVRDQKSEVSEEGESPRLTSDLRPLTSLGYCIFKDRYLKRDELGVIYQLCVAPGNQRKLVGASLLKAVFERSAYGCKLYCCWCAQDLEANHFWESMGFVPIAFRAGSDRKRRVHIFWQRRIDADQSAIGDPRSAIPYWFPFQTNSGAIREDRIVLPIPPGVHWKDVKAVEMAGGDRVSGVGFRVSGEEKKRLPSPARTPRSRAGAAGQPEPRDPNKVAIIVGGRIKYVDRPGAGGQGGAKPVAIEKPARKKPEKRAKAKIDTRYLAAARELRDRWLEHVNAGLVLADAPRGRYDVARLIPDAMRPPAPPAGPLLLPAVAV